MITASVMATTLIIGGLKFGLCFHSKVEHADALTQPILVRPAAAGP